MCFCVIWVAYNDFFYLKFCLLNTWYIERLSISWLNSFQCVLSRPNRILISSTMSLATTDCVFVYL